MADSTDVTYSIRAGEPEETILLAGMEMIVYRLEDDQFVKLHVTVDCGGIFNPVWGRSTSGYAGVIALSPYGPGGISAEIRSDLPGLDPDAFTQLLGRLSSEYGLSGTASYQQGGDIEVTIKPRPGLGPFSIAFEAPDRPSGLPGAEESDPPESLD